MKVFGSIERLVSILFRKDSQDITVRPNQATTYTAARDIQLPAGDAAHVLVSRTSTDTLTNKTIAAGSNTITGLADANIASGAAIDATKIADGSVTSTEFQYLGTVTSDIQTQLNGKQPLDADLTALAALATTGLIVRTGSGTVATRTLVAGTNISLTNADGVAGDITINSTATVSSFKATWLTADGTTKVVTHSLATTDIMVQIFDTTTGQTIEVDTATRTDANTLTLVASEAPATSWRVLILAL